MFSDKTTEALEHSMVANGRGEFQLAHVGPAGMDELAGDAAEPHGLSG